MPAACVVDRHALHVADMSLSFPVATILIPNPLNLNPYLCAGIGATACSLHLQAADSVEVAKAAPFVEKLVADGYEVLYLTEAIDEAMVTNLAKFGDQELIDVSKEGINLGSEEDAKKVRAALAHRGVVGSLRCSCVVRWDCGCCGQVLL